MRHESRLSRLEAEAPYPDDPPEIRGLPPTARAVFHDAYTALAGREADVMMGERRDMGIPAAIEFGPDEDAEFFRRIDEAFAPLVASIASEGLGAALERAEAIIRDNPALTPRETPEARRASS